MFCDISDLNAIIGYLSVFNQNVSYFMVNKINKRVVYYFLLNFKSKYGLSKPTNHVFALA